ncbi:hypothetical protein [Streptomyces sp. NPDC058665]|uniref:hypothetical protein n=1 Tax=Streptomyces sp. NPDC058665 TaxID=3346586 RepID=UPI00364DA8B8
MFSATTEACESSDALAAPPQGEGRGCLHTLSIPSCFGFLAFIGTLLLLAAVHDLTQ